MNNKYKIYFDPKDFPEKFNSSQYKYYILEIDVSNVTHFEWKHLIFADNWEKESIDFDDPNNLIAIPAIKLVKNNE